MKDIMDDKEILEELHKEGIYSKTDLMFGLLLQVFIRQLGCNLDDPQDFEERMTKCYKLLK